MLDRIEIFKYRRLLETSSYVGRKTVALVGPNEAGKSSVLSALRLFESTEPVPPKDVTRSLRGESLNATRDVVRLSLTLDADQLARAAALPIDVKQLRHLIFHKLADGQIRPSLEPGPVVLPKVKSDFAKAWPALAKSLNALEYAEGEEDAVIDQAHLGEVTAYLNGSTSKISNDAWTAVREAVSGDLGDETRLRAKLAAFDTFDTWLAPGADPQRQVLAAIDGAVPLFAQFGPECRLSRPEYSLSDEMIGSDAALRNLLALAQLPLEKILANRGDSGYLRTLLDEANARLLTYFSEKWKQEKVAVGLGIDGDQLQIHVRDLSEGSVGWMEITERSDGLRTFVALAAFLEAGGYERPPILLIDEAEQHLHLNAQGDLIRMLQDLNTVQQVIYTTHSPACLPADLGNGVRFVQPIDQGHSVIRHDFWSMDIDTHVGLNPLLIVMGAGAAAFSSLRRAVVVEGMSDALLLPTLIKLATGRAELEYQIVPGIASASKADMAKLDFVASRVTYQVDADDSGREWARQLGQAGVPSQFVRLLGNGLALEDLFTRGFYLDALADLGGLDRDALEAASTSIPIKTAVAQLNLRHVPGPIALAEYVLGGAESKTREIALSARGKRALADLDRWVLVTLTD